MAIGKSTKLGLRVLGGLLAIIVAAMAVLSLTFAPARLKMDTVNVGPLPAASPPAAMSISALPSGTYDTPAIFAYRGGALGETRHFAATAILVRHPKGNLLIDTGFGRNLEAQMKLIPAIQRSTHHKDMPVIDRLAAAGTGPQDLAGIIPTHVHWDHISGVDDLRGTPVMVHAGGQRFIASKAKGTEVINSFAPSTTANIGSMVGRISAFRTATTSGATGPS